MKRKVKKKLFQKNLLILFCLALIFSPFSSLVELAYAEGEQKEQLDEEVEEGVAQDNESDDSDEEATGSLENTEITSDDADDTSEENTTDTGDGGEDSSFEEEVKETDSTIQSSSTGSFQTLATTPDGDYEWDDNGDGTVTITGYTGNDTEVVIPNEINGKDVTIIAEGAFREKGLTKVTLPNTLKEIGMYSFFRNPLTHIDIPHGVTNIESFAFRVNKLETVTIPNSVTEIGNYAFTDNNLTDIYIPDSVTEIGIWAFRYNELEEVRISNNLTRIGRHVFDSNKLETVNIPDNVEEIQVGAFSNNELTNVVIPSSVVRVWDNAFSNNDIANVQIKNENLIFGSDIFADNLTNPGDVTIHGYSSSTAETYATDNNHAFSTFPDIPDDALRKAINEELGKDESYSPTKNDLEGLTEIGASVKGIQDLTGLEYATNLVKINLFNNNINDIRALSDLTGLEELNLRANEISDITILSNLTKLETLHIGENDISDISALENLTNLSILYAFTNKLSDISVLQNLEKLTQLYLNRNQISDLSPLQDLSNLRTNSYDDQSIQLDKVKILSTTSTLEIDNPLKGINGMIFDHVDIEEGSYNSPKIKWGELNGTEQTRKFTFDDGETNGFSGTVTQPIEWVIDELPIIYASDISVLLNEPFDPLDHVTASDKESGDLTSDIVVLKNEVDTSVPGIYEVTYEVTDHGGQTVEKTIIVTVTHLDVTDVADIADITVANGTNKSDAGLPTEVEVTLNDGDKQNVDVNWDNGDPDYDKFVAGTYVFTGVLDLPTGVVNPNNVEASVKVIVGDSYVTDVADIANIVVTNGTDKSDLGLPTEVEITLNDGTTQNVDVVWDDGDPAYDKSVAGNYVFTGTLDLPTGVVNTNDVEVTVTVAPQQLILPLEIKTEVFAGQVGTIEGTDTQITFPHDLPSGTFVTITDVSGEGFVTNAEGIERAGDVLDFKFEYPSGQSYTGSFELTMSYGNGFATEIDIYYYNENDAKWEAQNGTMDTNNNTITIHPDHFSTYGVFALEEDKPGDDPKGNGESEGSAPNGDGDNGNGKPITVDGGSDENDIKGTGDQVLPKTATNTFNMIAVGLILLVLGGISFVFIRRRALKQ